MKLANLNYMVFPRNTKPEGLLPLNEKAAQAAWWYYLLCQKVKERTGDSIDDQFGILEGNLWQQKPYAQIARTVAKVYQLESPDEFLRFRIAVDMEATRIGFPVTDNEYWQPLKVDNRGEAN